MIVAPRSAALGAANPLLSLYVLDGGALAAPASARFAVFDVSDDAKELSPVQVYPPSGTQAVDLAADRVPDLPVGHYAAAWDVPALEPLGKHVVRWTVETSAGERTFSEEFDVAAGAVGGRFRGYALPSDLRAEGVPSTYSEVRLQRALAASAAYIDKVTNRFFEPRALDLRLDGTGSGTLRFGFPVIALALAEYRDDAAGVNATPISLDDVRVYNRWLTQGMVLPDDRDDPRAEWVRIARPFPFQRHEPAYVIWRTGRQNVRVLGLFGYTDPDGGFVGSTPERIRHVAKLLALRDLPGAWGDSEREDVRNRHRLLSETTRDQSYTLGRDARLGASGGGADLTGDPDIDGILAEYAAPPFVGST